jgi:hypothetical protein
MIGPHRNNSSSDEAGCMIDNGRPQPQPQAALDEAGRGIHSEEIASEATQTVCIPEPILPIHLKESAGCGDSDWNAKALEALATQLTVTNDFHDPLIAAAQELRDLRRVHAALIELLRSVNPNSRSYTRFTHDSRGL